MKQLPKTVEDWLSSIAAAFIGGAASAITTTVVAPETFNFGDGLAKLLKVALISGILNAAFYLKKSPLPDRSAPTQTNQDTSKQP